ncbi:hypothetical protein Afil01_57670 [Actinorhabdospora filicis]|uniref:Uncharacterized protein n=1 Tax=Actinorhabdospora filicis TaxID=1785913 RepID=A0A9W6WDL4_9ACTN|nr:hypothetical protein Afil01_57670 [Actinorhabdospora filicis]
MQERGDLVVAEFGEPAIGARAGPPQVPQRGRVAVVLQDQQSRVGSAQDPRREAQGAFAQVTGRVQEQPEAGHQGRPLIVHSGRYGPVRLDDVQLGRGVELVRAGEHDTGGVVAVRLAHQPFEHAQDASGAAGEVVVDGRDVEGGLGEGAQPVPLPGRDLRVERSRTVVVALVLFGRPFVAEDLCVVGAHSLVIPQRIRHLRVS